MNLVGEARYNSAYSGIHYGAHCLGQLSKGTAADVRRTLIISPLETCSIVSLLVAVFSVWVQADRGSVLQRCSSECEHFKEVNATNPVRLQMNHVVARSDKYRRCPQGEDAVQRHNFLPSLSQLPT